MLISKISTSGIELLFIKLMQSYPLEALPQIVNLVSLLKSPKTVSKIER